MVNVLLISVYPVQRALSAVSLVKLNNRAEKVDVARQSFQSVFLHNMTPSWRKLVADLGVATSLRQLQPQGITSS